MPGRSGLCKNKACINPATNKRRQSQSKLSGYCATCAPVFEPALFAQRKVDTRVICSDCAQPFARLYDGRCKTCSSIASSSPSCTYCQVTLEKDSSLRCEYDASCRKTVYMCGSCTLVHGQAVCVACWHKGWNTSCFACRGPLVTTKDYKFKYCSTCFQERFTEESKDVADVISSQFQCFYCRESSSDAVRQHKCGHIESCPGEVLMCDRCVGLH